MAVLRKQGRCESCKRMFREIFRLYTPEMIKVIRKSLRETPDVFGKRFFVTGDTVKGWEAPEGSSKNRELTGPAVRIMIMVQDEAIIKRNEKARELRLAIKNANRSNRKRFEYERCSKEMRGAVL